MGKSAIKVESLRGSRIKLFSQLCSDVVVAGGAKWVGVPACLLANVAWVSGVLGVLLATTGLVGGIRWILGSDGEG